MPSPHAFLAALAVGFLPLTHALFSLNSTFASNGITIVNQKFNGIIPSGVLSEQCASAYSASLNCSNSLVFVGPDYVNYTAITKEIPATAYHALYKDVCTEACYKSLASWRTAVQVDCAADFDTLFSEMYNDYTDPEAVLNESGLTVPGAGSGASAFGFVYRDGEAEWLDYMFWGKCTRDLNSTEYCTLTELDADVAVWPSIEASRFSHLSKEEAIERNQTFCSEATCFMQSELLSVISTGEFQGNNATQADVIAVINDVCPDLNVTSSFPFLQLGSMYPFDDEKKISSTGVTSTSTRGADGITDLTTANSTDTSGSSPGMPAPASLLLHLICFVAVAGVSLML